MSGRNHTRWLVFALLALLAASLMLVPHGALANDDTPPTRWDNGAPGNSPTPFAATLPPRAVAAAGNGLAGRSGSQDQFGSVTGVVTDGVSAANLPGVQIVFDNGALQFTFSSNASGQYSGVLPVGTYTATATLTHYAPASQSGIEITENVNTVVNFALYGSTLSVSPATVDQSVEIGSTADVPLTLSVSGPLPVDVQAAVYTTLDDRIYGVYASYEPLPAFAYMNRSGDTITKLDDFALGASRGGDFLGDDFSTVYALADMGDYDPANDAVVAIDTATGAVSVVAVLPVLEGGQYMSMSYDPVTRQMYLVGVTYNLWGWPLAQYLNTVDVKTGAFGQAVPLITPYAGTPTASAFDDQGNLFLYDAWNFLLVQVDPATRIGVNVGPLDAFTEVDNGMDWDPVTGQMYLTTWLTAGGGELRIIDLTSGSSTLVSRLGSVYPGLPDETAFLWIAFASAPVDWGSVAPTQLTVPANGSAALTLSLDTRRLAELGDYQARIGFIGNYVAPASLHAPVTMHVVCANCGTLAGSISDAWTAQPLAADVRITNANGVDIRLNGSSYQATVKPGAYTIAASAEGYLDATETVQAATGATTTTDLALLPRAGLLSYTPGSVHVTAQIGDVVTEQVTVMNTGTIPMSFRMHLNSEDLPAANPARQPLGGEAALDIRAYGMNTDGVAGSLAWFDLADPTTLNVLPAFHPHGSLVAGDFFGDDFSTLYAFEESKLIALDTATGAKTIVGALPLISPYGQYSSMSYDPVSGEMVILYAYDLYSPRFIYRVNVETAEATLVGEISSTALGLIDAIEFDDSGILYAVDFDNNLLATIDLPTMAVTVIGDLGFDAGANYQGLSFDSAHNQLYLSANAGVNWPFTSNLYRVNTQTAQATLVATIGSAFPGGPAAVLSGLAIASPAQNWVDVPQEEITVAAGGSVTLDLVFDTRSLFRTGLYSAGLSFSGDFINAVTPLPVSLNLGCSGCATLTGSIRDQATNAPLPATLHIVGPNGFDLSLKNRTAYNLTVQPGAYQFNVSRSGFAGQTATVNAAANTTTTTDFALAEHKLDIVFDPTSFALTLAPGASATRAFTITNQGNIDFTYQVLDREFGDDPSGSIPLTSCGAPDPFGYACLDSHQSGGPVASWLDISSTGTPLGLDGANDFYFPIELPFDFSFYGQNHRQIAVSSYGQIYFEDAIVDPNWGGPQPLPADMGAGVNTFIVPFWSTSLYYDDWAGDPNVAPPATYYEVQGVAPYRRLVISWENIPTELPSWQRVRINFQAILFEGSNNILYQYGEMNGITGLKATVGIQGNATTASQFSHRTASLTDDMAICFVHPDATLGQCDLGYPANASWMSQSPTSGALAAGGSQPVAVVFDAASLQPGVYRGQIYFGGAWNDPLTLPVTLTVELPTAVVLGQLSSAAQPASAPLSSLPLAAAPAAILAALGLLAWHRRQRQERAR